MQEEEKLTFFGGPLDGFTIQRENLHYKGEYAKFSCLMKKGDSVEPIGQTALYFPIGDRLEFVKYERYQET